MFGEVFWAFAGILLQRHVAVTNGLQAPSHSMDFDTWTQTGHDSLRTRRLVMGYGVGVASVVLVATFVSLTASGGARNELEDEQVRSVELATLPEVAEPEPEPEPAAAPPPVEPKATLKRLTVPVEVPDDAPEEVEPTQNNPYDSGDPYMYAGAPEPEAPKPIVAKAVAPPPKPVVEVKPKPKPAAPVRVTENMSQPVCTIPAANYPPGAKAQGIEGTVIVRFVVTETGEVRGVRAMRGPAELREVSEAAVRSATCTPAILDGAPVMVFQARPFRFRLKT